MRRLWLLGVLGFLGLLFWQIWSREPQFYYSAQDYFHQAQESLLSDNERSLALARKAREKDPGNWQYGDFLAWRLLEAKRPAEALDLFRRVWEARPSVSALEGQVLALEALHRRPEALRLLEAHLANQPGDATLLKLGARLASQEAGRQEQALTYYQQLAELAPRDRESRRQIVQLLSALGRYDEAIPWQEQLVAAQPEDPQLLHHLALLHAWRRDYQAAAVIYRQLLELAADNQALRLEAAKNAEAAQNLDEALAHTLRLYAQSGGQKEPALRLARLWSQKGRHADAAAVLAPLLKEQPTLEERRWYGVELLLAQEYVQSLRAHQQAWEAGDTHKDTIINLARLHAQQNQFHKAAGFWDEAERRQLLDSELRREAALTYSYARRYREAINVLKPVPRDDPKLLLFLGQMHFYQQHWEQAAHYYEEYLQRSPQDAGVRRQLAQVLSFIPHRRAEAAQHYEESARIAGDPGLQLQRAAVLLQWAQDATNAPDLQDQAPARWAAAGAALQQTPQAGLSPELLREQGRLFLWLGDLERALERLNTYLGHAPWDRQAHLDKARTLIYLERGAEAAEVLRRLPPPGPLVPDSRTDRFNRPSSTTAAESAPEADGPAVANGELPPPRPPEEKFRPRVAPRPGLEEEEVIPLLFLEAALADGNWPEAQRRAWQLYLTQLPPATPTPRTWTAARRRLQEVSSPRELSPEARVGIARALCRHPHLDSEQGLTQAAVDLCVANLRPRPPVGALERRSYQASVMLLAYLLPRLSHFDDLQTLVHRLPGVRSQSPEYLAALHYFTSDLGRQGGKLQFLLQTLKDRRERYPVRLPGDLAYLAALAAELGDQRLAVRYLDQARRLRPDDQRLTARRLQALSATNDPGRLLKALDEQPQTPETALEMARTYLQRHQYEGAAAALAAVPRGHALWPQAQMLLIQAHQGQGNASAVLGVVQELEAQGAAGPAVLMARAQALESLDDRAGAQAAYETVLAQAPDAVAAHTARARLARFRGDWAGAYREFAAALKDQPQNIQLLNELEQVREQLRPTLGARNLPAAWRGERRPEEAWRPWQFNRPDREPGFRQSTGSAVRPPLPFTLPVALIPEITLLEDHNRIQALETRLAGGFWLGRTLPVHLALGYRVYQQHTTGPGPGNLNLGLQPVFSQDSRLRTTWERAEATLTLGPLVLGNRVSLTGDLSLRGYWKRRREQVTQFGQEVIPFPPAILNTLAQAELSDRDQRQRLLGGLAARFSPQAQTDVTLRYSRRDIFDQDPAIYPRLYQQVNRLDTLPLITLDQADLALDHQFFPGLSYQGSIAQAIFSDLNERFALYQGLRWQAVNDPRMHLALTPSYYLALYKEHHDSYFSPHAYHALGVTLDLDRQLFPLPVLSRFLSLVPTLVVQTTVQMVGHEGRWGPALSTLVGLEAEPIQNFYLGLHYFYFREWAVNYWFNSLIGGLKWRF